MNHQSQKSLRRAERDRLKQKAPRAPRGRSSSSAVAEPSSCSCQIEPQVDKNKNERPQQEENTQIGGLLADFARGAIEPEPVKLPNVPEGASPTVMKVVEDLELLFGLRLAVGDDRPMLYSVRWRTQELGISHQTMSQVLTTLVRWGALIKGEPMPFTRTQTFLPSDGMPGAELESGAVTVEAEDVPSGLTVDPPAEPPQEASVGDAVGGGAAGVLNRPVAVEGGTEGDVVSAVVHDEEAYELAELEPPPSHRLFHRAAEKAKPGTRNATGFWLACQLRDNDTRPNVAWELMGLYAISVPKGDHPYEVKEAHASYRQAYSRPPRQPPRKPVNRLDG